MGKVVKRDALGVRIGSIGNRARDFFKGLRDSVCSEYMETEIKRMALRLKVHNISGGVVHHVAILKRYLDKKGIKCEMVKGFCVIPETKEACEHYWVRTDLGLDLDVVFEVAKLRSPELQVLHPVLLETLESCLVNRSDENALALRQENERQFELFQRAPKAFWREAPRDARDFRLN